MLGTVSLVLFFLILLASIRKWLPQDVLPLQSVLVLGSLLLLVLALVFGQPFRPAQLFAATTLHPITATIAGFLLAGAVETAGGFAAAGRILSRLGKGFIGLSGTVLLLVNIPTIFAMPCGRIWAAALIPTAVMFGTELAEQKDGRRLTPIIVFGLIINAAASCGPSPLGGIGMMGEGTAGFQLHAFSNPQQMATMIITLLAMIWVGTLYKFEVNPKSLLNRGDAAQKLPETAYFAFLLYVLGLAGVFIFRPPIPIQAVVLAMTILVMIAGNVGLRSLMAGIILHPVTAMVAGFMMAGALVITGGFETLAHILSWLATHTPLGYIGVSVLLIYLPVIFPMPCGRVIAAALLPGVIMFGQQVARVTGHPSSLPALLVGFILCCAASCAPSPLGGIGSIGEGNLGLRGGASTKPLQLSILMDVPVAALIVTYVGLSTDLLRIDELCLALGLAILCGVCTNVLLGYKFYKPGGILGGLIVAGLIMVL
ncbi:MAG: hypothetical protein JRJ71_12925 [Deltaproteobacteria bacterium]|nr:hypothetical protein [Deltaproteobacteria bacterium]